MIKNNIKGTSVAYSAVPATLGTLLALGSTYLYKTIVVMSSLDTDVVLKFGDNEVTFPANKNVTIDNICIGGTIQYKYASAPSSGSLQIICHD